MFLTVRKFNPGNIVRIKTGNDNIILAVVSEVTRRQDGVYEYAILEKDTGRYTAWWSNDKLDFVAKGSLHEIEKCKEKWLWYEENQRNLKYIKEQTLENWLSVTTTSIEVLFEKVGFKIANEFFKILSDWIAIHPMFEAIFKGDYETTLNYTNQLEEHKDKILSFYNEMNPKE